MMAAPPRPQTHALRTISSRHHPIVRRYRAIAQSVPHDESPRPVLLDGFHLIGEAVSSGVPIESAAFDRALLERPDVVALVDRLSEAGSDVFGAPKPVLDALSPVRTPSGAVAIALRDNAGVDATVAASKAIVVLLHDVQDPGN